MDPGAVLAASSLSSFVAQAAAPAGLILTFHIGQRVSVMQSGRGATPGAFKVVRALPPEGRGQQYRVKCDTEAFERIVDESRLQASPL